MVHFNGGTVPPGYILNERTVPLGRVLNGGTVPPFSLSLVGKKLQGVKRALAHRLKNPIWPPG